jgi:signal transduction histidine kinase/CheY-like chemotaxis protein
MFTTNPDKLATLELLVEALDCLPQGLAIHDHDFHTLLANERSAQVFADHFNAMMAGATFEEAIYQGVVKIYPDLPDEKQWEIANMIAARHRAGEPIDIKRPDGKILRIIYQPMSNGRYVSVSIDITELRQRERELKEARKQADAANEAKSSFLANISHEIRTPLNGILGMAQVLNQSQLSLSQREQVEAIFESGKTLKALVDDVLDLSKIEAGRMELSPIEKDLRHVLRRLQRLWSPRAQEKGFELFLAIDSEMHGFLKFDPVRVSQCVANLLSNAIKFTERGEINVRVWSRAEGDWTRVFVEVTDTGIGLTKEAISKLFTPFTQADNSISRRFGGTGLGLSITRKLANLMGGDVVVASKPSQGSIFTLTFRAQPAQLQAQSVEQRDHEPGSVPTPMRGVGKKILLVDDHPLNRKVARLFLEPEGFEVTEAENGLVALERLAAQFFDIVLLDVHMPVLDGIETLKRIRASTENWREIPVLALTADAMSGDRERYLACGMNGYVSKPMEQRQLLAEIDRIRGISPRADHGHEVRLVNVIHSEPAPAPISDSELAGLFTELDQATIAKTGS